jgi:hypothetical protein
MINVDRTIISQYANSPTIVGLVESMDDWIDPRANLDDFYNYVWNIDTAQGFGLDIWGRILGVGRTINVPADTPNPGHYTFTPGVLVLADDQYRQLLMVKALSNITDCTAGSLNKLLSKLFAGRGRCYVNDLGGMKMRFVFEFFLQPFEYAILMTSGVTPGPAGVLLDVIQCVPTQTFGFAEAIQFQPFDQGTFYEAQ